MATPAPPHRGQEGASQFVHVGVFACVCAALHVCDCVRVKVCMHPLHAFHRHTVRLTAGRPRMRAAPSPRFSPDASLECSHYTLILTHTQHNTRVTVKASVTKGMKAHDVGWSMLSQINNVHFAEHTFLDAGPQALHPEVDEGALRQ